MNQVISHFFLSIALFISRNVEKLCRQSANFLPNFIPDPLPHDQDLGSRISRQNSNINTPTLDLHLWRECSEFTKFFMSRGRFALRPASSLMTADILLRTGRFEHHQWWGKRCGHIWITHCWNYESEHYTLQEFWEVASRCELQCVQAIQGYWWNS